MSLLTNQSEVNPNKAFWAPASGGGGGNVSSISNGFTSVVCDISGMILSASDYISGAAGYVNWNSTVCLPSGCISTPSISTTSLSASNVGIEESGFLDAPAISGQLRLQAASLGGGSGAQLLYISSAINTVSMLVTNSNIQVLDADLTVSSINGAQYPPAQPTALSLSTLTMNTNGYIDAPAVNGSLRIQKYTTGSQGSQLEYISSGVNCAALNFGVSTLEAVQSDLLVSSINSQQPVGTFAGQQMPGGFQAGYVNQLPYQSTVLFAHPYSDDKVCVSFGATNAGVSGGANPNISLDAGYGTNGVSSIGFAVDMRNGGVGFQGNFYWMAFPWTN